eukprot:jgi/Chlat1/9099/Chrsp97S08378
MATVAAAAAVLGEVCAFVSSPRSAVLRRGLGRVQAFKTPHRRQRCKSTSTSAAAAAAAAEDGPSSSHANGNGRVELGEEKATEKKDPGPWMIVGLGNPGKQYANTRHNVGFDLVDALARSEGVAVAESRYNALVGRGRVRGHPVMIVKPQTYMNRSGTSVGQLSRYYKVARERILVCYDDMDLEVAAVRLRAKGGHGGHNGMKSIIEQLGGNRDFPRLRIGIGRPAGRVPTEVHVLQPFTRDEREEVLFVPVVGVVGIDVVHDLLL